MGDVFPELRAKQTQIEETLKREEESFNKTSISESRSSTAYLRPQSRRAFSLTIWASLKRLGADVEFIRNVGPTDWEMIAQAAKHKIPDGPLRTFRHFPLRTSFNFTIPMVSRSTSPN